ncbi:general secretion pathway protein J [Oxalobacteraceae bacterium GrIS 2.11]
MPCKQNSRGFTLIELLVAISILAIVAVLGFRGLQSIVQSRAALTSELEQTRGLQLTFAQLQSDCAHNVNPFNFPNLPEGRSSWIEPQRLILIRNVFSDDQAPAMQLVTYRVVNDNLTRFESISTRDLSVLTQLLSQARNPPEKQVEIVMQKNIEELQFTGYPESSLTGSTNTPTPGANPNDLANPPNPASTAGTPPPGPNLNSGNPPVNNGVQNVDLSKATTGLQVSLQLKNHPKGMLKIFILGGV